MYKCATTSLDSERARVCPRCVKSISNTAVRRNWSEKREGCVWFGILPSGRLFSCYAHLFDDDLPRYNIGVELCRMD